MFRNDKIVFVGAGSMAEAIISGLLKNDLVKNEQIWATNYSNDKRLQELEEKYLIHTTRNHQALFQDATVVILAMKPKDVKTSLLSIRNYLTKDQLILSVIAGVSLQFFEKILNEDIPVIRSMPNTSAALNKSATAIALGTYCDESHRRKAKTFLESIGTVVPVDEGELHAATALAGSGPAYLYYLAEALEESAIEQGLSEDGARQLMIQTFVGAAKMLQTSNETPLTLRKNVTSPGGTTEAGINALIERGFEEAVKKCIEAAVKKSRELEAQYRI